LVTYIFNPRHPSLNLNSALLSTLLPLAHHAHPLIRQKAASVVLNLHIDTGSPLRNYLHECVMANGELLEQLLMLTQPNRNIEADPYSLALLRAFCGQPNDHNNANARLLSRLLPQSLYFALLRHMEDETPFTEFLHDYDNPDLVWNETARNHLRNSIEEELIHYIRPFIRDIRERRINDVEWAYLVGRCRDFHIDYEDVLNEIIIRGKFVRFLCETNDNQNVDYPTLTDDLYDRLVCEDTNVKRVKLLRYLLAAMTRGRCTAVQHVRYLTKHLLLPAHFSYLFAVELLSLLRTAVEHADMALQFINDDGIALVMYHLETIHHRYCLSEDVKEISQITLHILSLLTTVCRLSRARQIILSSRDYMHCIVKSILISDTAVINAAGTLVRNLLESIGPMSLITSRFDTSKLFETGIFEFIVRQLRLGCSESIASLLKHYHNVQRFDRGGDDQSSSYLSYFLPMQFVNLLEKHTNAVSPTSVVGVASATGTTKTGIELFTQAINQISVSTGPINPYMMWSNEHCDKMVS
jgi:hypothetical protein